MNFKERMLPTKREYAFSEEGYHVWCGTAFSFGGNCYLIYSRWEKQYGFEAWVTHSEICLAKAENIFGEFRHVKVLFGKDETNRWDKDVKHNPTALVHNGKIYLYYMGNYGNGDWWTHRNNQRIGVAVTDNPEGEWVRCETPVIDVSEHGFDSLMTSNPTVTEMPNGKILMVYKGVSKDGELPKGGAVVCGVAIADKPMGSFIKQNTPIMQNPNDPWSVEDPFIWVEHGRFYALVKDFHGYFTKTNSPSVALFVSENGIDWEAEEEHPLAFECTISYDDGVTEPVHRLERPQLYFEDGAPKALLCACAKDTACEESFHIRIPLKY